MSDRDNGNPVVRDDDGVDINFGLRIIGAVGGLCLFAISAMAFVNGSPGTGILLFLLLALWLKIQSDANMSELYARRKSISQHRDHLIKETNSLEKVTSKAITELQARQAGDIIIAGDNNTIINRSELRNSMNTLSQQDENLSEALKIIAGFVEKAQNREAADLLNEFNKKIVSGENKITLKSIWKNLVSVVPDIVTLGEAVAKIYAFLG